MKTFTLILLATVLCLNTIQAQYTLVPDPNFEQALIDLGIDSEGTLDGQFLTSDALGIIVLDVRYKNISDLTGLEAFVDLHDLWASNNNLTSVDLSVLPSTMWTLSLSNNNLSAIDLSPISGIVNLLLSGNNLISIYINNFSNLFVVGISNQPIMEVILNNCPNLQVLEFANTSLTSIDLSECPSLRRVQCQDSQIQTLDFTYNQNLEDIYCYNTPLTNINLPNNPDLEYMAISNNQLTALNLTNCPSLWHVSCSNNLLTNLDLSGNPVLEDLRCSNNQLSTINLTQNTILNYLSASNNLFATEIDFSNNINLEALGLAFNPLTTIDVTNCTNLKSISCWGSDITEIDLSLNTAIETADFYQCPNIEFVNIKNGNTENIFFTGTQCPQLSCVVVDDPSASNNNILIDSHTTLVGSVEECDELSIDENEFQNLVTVYPNPIKNTLFIENHENIVIEKIIVNDILGKVILIEKNSFNQLNLSHLNNGILFLKIETDKGTITKKLIKE